MTTPAKSSTLAQALIAFQGEAPHIPLDGTNPHFKSKFATLAGVMNAVRPVLAKHGLALSQHPTCWDSRDGPLPALRTVLLHVSGEREEDVMLLSVDKPGAQAQGSALTYARRYAALSILGLVGDDDDDGNKATTQEARLEELSTSQEARLEELSTSLVANGAITQDQLEAAQSSANRADLLARLERYAETIKT